MWFYTTALKRQVYNKDYEFRSVDYVNENYPDGYDFSKNRTYHENGRLKRYLVNGINNFYDSR